MPNSRCWSAHGSHWSGSIHTSQVTDSARLIGGLRPRQRTQPTQHLSACARVSTIQITWSALLGLRLHALRQVIEHIHRLVHGAQAESGANHPELHFILFGLLAIVVVSPHLPFTEKRVYYEDE